MRTHGPQQWVCVRKSVLMQSECVRVCDGTHTAIGKERVRATRCRTERWAWPQKPRVLPASWLGQDGEPRRSTTVQTTLGNNNIAHFPLQGHNIQHTTRLVANTTRHLDTSRSSQNLPVTSLRRLKSRSGQTHKKSVTTSARVVGVATSGGQAGEKLATCRDVSCDARI